MCAAALDSLTESFTATLRPGSSKRAITIGFQLWSGICGGDFGMADPQASCVGFELCSTSCGGPL